MPPRPRQSSLDADAGAWGPPPTLPTPPTEEQELDPAQVVEKEKLVKEITTMQEGLRALLERVAEVQGEGDKLRSNNATLQTYIDNLTRNAIAAGASGAK